MRRTARSCPTMRAASFSSNSCARGLFWSGSSRTVLTLIFSLSIAATMARPPLPQSNAGARPSGLRRAASVGGSRPSGPHPALLYAKSEPHFFDESLKEVVFLQRWPGGGALPKSEALYINKGLFVTTKCRAEDFFLREPGVGHAGGG